MDRDMETPLGSIVPDGMACIGRSGFRAGSSKMCIGCSEERTDCFEEDAGRCVTPNGTAWTGCSAALPVVANIALGGSRHRMG